MLESLLTALIRYSTLWLALPFFLYWLSGNKRLALGSALLPLGCGLTVWAMHKGAASLLGLGFFLLCGVMIGAVQRCRRTMRWRWSLITLLLVATGCAYSHKIPGVVNLLLIKEQMLTPQAYPLTQYVNFDKTLMGLLLVLGFVVPARKWEEWRLILRTYLKITPVTAVILMGLGMALHWIAFDPKWPTASYLPFMLNLPNGMQVPTAFWPSFAFNWIVLNLLVCVAEEVFFRKLVQDTLSTAMSERFYGSLVVTTLIFVIFHAVHVPDWRYLVLVGIAGLAYGGIYHVTRRIEASVLLHFTVNLLHFFFFTYPALRFNPV